MSQKRNTKTKGPNKSKVSADQTRNQQENTSVNEWTNQEELKKMNDRYRQVLEVMLDRLADIQDEEDTKHFKIFIAGNLTVEQLYAEERKVKTKRESGSSDQNNGKRTNTKIKKHDTELNQQVLDQEKKIESLEKELKEKEDKGAESERQLNEKISNQLKKIESLEQQLKEIKESKINPPKPKDIELVSVKADDVKKENKELQTKNRKTIEDQERKIEKLTEELEQTKNVVEEKEKEIANLRKQNTELQRIDDKNQRPSSRNKKEKEDFADKEHMRKNLGEKDNEIQQLRKDLQNKENIEKMFQAEQDRLTKEVEELEAKLRETQMTETDLKKQLERKYDENEEIKRLTDEVNGLRTRLSQMAGSKLTDNNPAIADLSDQNRPISLGEKFSELYDNEWTDAMEEIHDKEGEKEAIQSLLTIVKEAYTYCQMASEDLLKSIMGNMNPFLKLDEIPQEVKKLCKDHRKTLALHVVNSLQEVFLKKQKKYADSKVFPNMVKYIKKCAQLTWFMTVQDPMVAFDASVPNYLDLDIYKPYTKQGPHMEYLVWPPLYLHKTDGKFGPMLGKGVAQGKK